MGRIYLPEEDLAKIRPFRARNSWKPPIPRAFGHCLPSKQIAPANSMSQVMYLLAYISEDSQPASGCWSTSIAVFLRRLPKNSMTSSPPKSASSTWEKLRILGKGFLKRLT